MSATTAPTTPPAVSPPDQADLGRVQLRRVNAFQGLMIDATIWRDAHDYHRSQMRLHNLALHGWGIAHGLDVTLSDERNTVVVHPGIAVDPSGNFVIVAEPYVHRIESSHPATLYLLIQFSEVPSGPTQPPDDPRGQPTRVVEAYRIQQREEVPDGPRLELCRVDFDPLAGALKAPEDAAQPGKNELDTRYRAPIGATGTLLPVQLPSDWGWTTDAVVARTPGASPLGTGAAGTAATTNGAVAGRSRAAGAAPAAAAPAAQALTLVVARHAGQGWDAHAAGLQSLVRELRHAGQTVELRESALGGSESEDAHLVYLTGQARLELGPSEREALGRLLERGAVVVGDGCTCGPRGDAGARDFAHSFTQICEDLGRHLEAVQRGHAALTGRHLFAVVPPGARENALLLSDAEGGALYCDADYGCAWNGGAPERPLPRGAIRDALELGANLVTLATK
jgi:hypothetical protein